MDAVDQKHLDMVLRYHEETKHHLFRYARALGYLDWDNQPNPFRRYDGAPLISLPILALEQSPVSPPYRALYDPGSIPPAPISLHAISRFFEYSLALTAWKQAGASKWALRANPSSGNLHPTEGYLFIDALPELASVPGLYHYAPKEHALERRMDCPPDRFTELMKDFPPHSFLVGLSSIYWREAWKYGERAFRYCQHDAGHAIGALRIAAAALGWRMMVLHGTSDDTIETLLGLNRTEDYESAEREDPEMLAVIWPYDSSITPNIPLHLDPSAMAPLSGAWHGKANRLSVENPVAWDIIPAVAAASWKTTTETMRVLSASVPRFSTDLADRGPVSAGEIIHRRRSAVDFDGKTAISVATFFGMLSRVMPETDRSLLGRPTPWDTVPWAPTIHLCLFVHRVDGSPPGLYVLVRDPAKLDLLKNAMHPEFSWTRPPGCPEALPLYLLQEGDARKLATQVSCHQGIAGDGAFSLGMVAEFEPALRDRGAWFYRRLFWETGLIGQVLYLEAEAAGVRATGIGCFFDDPVHQVFGFKGTDFQSLYHFTMGGAVDDPRLTTLPPYGAHVEEQERGMDLP